MIDIRNTAKPGPTFDAESMRALLAGRKAQTRRVLKGPESQRFSDEEMRETMALYADVLLPYRVDTVYYARESLQMRLPGFVEYAADGTQWTDTDGRVKLWPWKCRVLAPHCMPRWAARVFPRITDVRVQRLGEISEADIGHEGIRHGDPYIRGEMQLLWMRRWEQVNGEDSWLRDRNKWVAAYTFEIVEPEGV
jgi:hypothetical protein